MHCVSTGFPTFPVKFQTDITGKIAAKIFEAGALLEVTKNQNFKQIFTGVSWRDFFDLNIRFLDA